MATDKVNKIEVRMYRIGTGDCFVLKFKKDQNDSFNMMIDCGSCRGNSDTFKPFIQNIKTYTNSHINLLVISHEHSDHIIGFAKSIDLFKQFTIDNVWVAWTENPEDEFAKSLKEQYGKEVHALSLAIKEFSNQLNNPSFETMIKKDWEGQNIKTCKENFLAGLQNIHSLSNDTDVQALAVRGKTQMQKAMDFVINKTREKNHQSPFYCYPGKKVPKLKGLEGINVNVLGPPKNEILLKKEEIEDEMYERKHTLNSDFDFVNALTQIGESSHSKLPFSKTYIIEEPEKELFINENLRDKDNEWRNIETDWIHASGALAIRLERFMNNLSLVLAIEFEKSGKVLLFPGDAQIGNWKSWHEDDLKWRVKTNGRSRYIKARDLLKNTVFYKVGHHLSHNGTASKSGLDLMDHDELTAFASLDINNILSVWKRTMPAPGILDELIKRTKGRVFTIDNGLMDDNGAKEARNTMTQEELDYFKSSYRITKNYVQYTIRE